MGMLVTDMMHRRLTVPECPGRIVSVVPSQTELLYSLGLDEEVIAITKFCIHPDQWFRSKQRIGGTKKLHLQQILDLNPDLILANKEENTQAEIEWLAERVPVWISDIRTLPDALEMIRSVGALVCRAEQANALAARIAASFANIPVSNEQDKRERVAYFIWRDPWMAAGNDTFIDEMLRAGGWENAFASLSRYPELCAADIRNAQPDRVFLSSEPYPFKEKHIAELQEIVPEARITLVDGELFSWYGSRLLQSAAYFHSLRSLS